MKTFLRLIGWGQPWNEAPVRLHRARAELGMTELMGWD